MSIARLWYCLRSKRWLWRCLIRISKVPEVIVTLKRSCCRAGIVLVPTFGTDNVIAIACRALQPSKGSHLMRTQAAGATASVQGVLCWLLQGCLRRCQVAVAVCDCLKSACAILMWLMPMWLVPIGARPWHI